MNVFVWAIRKLYFVFKGEFMKTHRKEILVLYNLHECESDNDSVINEKQIERSRFRHDEQCFLFLGFS